MGKLTLCGIGSMLMGIALSLGTCSPLLAQYPLLPSISNGNANYEWRPDLGGWRDKQTNLVWGYSHSQVSSTSSTYGGALIVARGYSQSLLNAAQDSATAGRASVAGNRSRSKARATRLGSDIQS